MRYDSEYEKYWKELLEQFKKEKVSIKAFCEKNNVKVHQFTYWYDKLIKGKVKSKKKAFVKVHFIVNI